MIGSSIEQTAHEANRKEHGFLNGGRLHLLLDLAPESPQESLDADPHPLNQSRSPQFNKHN